jgi:hypothetical protein
MPIIGKLIKKTAEISFRRTFRKGRGFEQQVQTLQKLIDRAKNTQFGKEYEFKKCLASPNLIESFQAKTPITEYNDFYEKWLIPCIEGKRDIIWPGRIRHYALSSGTTGSPSKRIPITVQMIRSFQRSSIKQIATLHELNLSDEFFEASVLAVGGSTKLVKMPTHIEGDLSGILKKYTARVASPFAKPPSRISKLKNWNEKMELMVEKAPEWNIGIMAGVPSWCIMLIERVVEKHKLNSIHDIWPNFKVYIHGGVFMDPYADKLKKLMGEEVHLLDSYLASEGYFGYQSSPNKKGMELLLENGVFFEFVPFNSDYFNDDGTLRDCFEALALNEIEEGEDYALIISTNAGLWRYMIGDLVRLIDKDRNAVQVTGRIKQFLSLVGEHLSLDNMNSAIARVAKNEGIEISEFTIYPDGDAMKHRWYIGVDTEVSNEKLMLKIDQEISRINDDYASSRKHNLKDPELVVIPTSKFYEFLQSIGKSGAQNKFPRVMNTEQKRSWVNFLEEEN